MEPRASGTAPMARSDGFDALADESEVQITLASKGRWWAESNRGSVRNMAREK
jgi:hypothetical protein